MIQKFIEEHARLVSLLLDVGNTEIPPRERKVLLSLLREEIVAHTIREAKYFEDKYPNKEFKKIFDDNFITNYTHILASIDGILNTETEYVWDSKYISDTLKGRILLEENVLFPALSHKK
ncbi:MAG: hypothetical protein HQL69_04340 [Magnetococcales bacterium]|nr:hypothetical protein [Magnetococcales bacterium]